MSEKKDAAAYFLLFVLFVLLPRLAKPLAAIALVVALVLGIRSFQSKRADGVSPVTTSTK